MSLLFALLATAAIQDDKKDEKKTIEWEKLEAGPVERGGKFAHGTRVKITLRNGNTLRGFVVHPEYLKEVNPKNWRPKPYDFAKATTVALDISLEQPQLGGYVFLKKTELRMPIIELNPLDTKKLAELEAERDRVRKEQGTALEDFEKRREEERKKEEEARKKAGTGDVTDPIEAGIKKLEELKAAKAFYDKYPEGSEEDQTAGKAWGPGRLKAIQDKAKNNVPLSEDEKDFMSNYDQWTLGKKYTDELKKEEEKKKEEGGNP